jgi:predicted transcriptional regulator
LEEELKVLQDQLLNQTSRFVKTTDEKDMNKRLMNEIEMLKGKQDYLKRPGTAELNVESLRKERNELQEENRRLVAMLKDNKKWDVYLLQREVERLQKNVINQG